MKFTFFYSGISLLLLSGQIPSITSQDEGCTWTNRQTDEKWKLIWMDDFEQSQVDPKKWTIADQHDDSPFCDSFLECLSAKNVRQESGFLLVSSTFYEFENYTSSRVTTPKFLKPGRIEFRARLPEDTHSVARIQASLDSSSESFINLLVKYLEVYQSYRMQLPKSVKMIIPKSAHDLSENGFHIFGIEWTYTGVSFFWNGETSQVLPFGRKIAQEMTQKSETLQLTLDVSYPTRRMHLPAFEQTRFLRAKNTSCSALVIDYLKVYEKIDPGQAAGAECLEVRNEATEVQFSKLNPRNCQPIGTSRKDRELDFSNLPTEISTTEEEMVSTETPTETTTETTTTRTEENGNSVTELFKKEEPSGEVGMAPNGMAVAVAFLFCLYLGN